MKMNEGNVDRALRLGLGVVVFGLGFAYNSLWGLVGLVPFATGLVGWCPLYDLVGLKTK